MTHMYYTYKQIAWHHSRRICNILLTQKTQQITGKLTSEKYWTILYERHWNGWHVNGTETSLLKHVTEWEC